MLGVVGQQCCVRLHGAKSLTDFKLCATKCNRVYKRPQLVTSNNVGSCRPTMLRPFVRSLTLCWESLFDHLATSLNFTFKWLDLFDLDFYPTFPVTLAKPKIRSIGNREYAIITAVSKFGQKSRKNGHDIVGNCCLRLQQLKVLPVSNYPMLNVTWTKISGHLSETFIN